MRILFLTQLFPYPPVCGGTIKSYNILRHLGARHDVTLAAFVRSEPTNEQMEAVRSLTSDVRTVPIHRSAAANLKFAAMSLVNRSPFIITRDRVPEMQRLVDELTRSNRFDLIYVDHLQMAQYVTDLSDCPKVLDEHNVEWKIIERIAISERPSPKRLFAEIEWSKLRDWELKTCEAFDMVLTVTERDRETLLSENPRLKNVACVPIGVDFDSFPRIDLRPDAKDILSMGTMSWPPNIDSVQYFAEGIYPQIKARVEGAKFIVAGSNPPESIKNLSVNDESIEVTGFVEDPGTVASRTAVFVVPLRSGSGLRVKILNAMAMGMPIVSTSVGCEGIGAEHGRHLLIADSEKDFADAVVKLISDFELRVRIGKAGQQFVLANYAWEGIYKKLDAALYSVAAAERERAVLRR